MSHPPDPRDPDVDHLLGKQVALTRALTALDDVELPVGTTGVCVELARPGTNPAYRLDLLGPSGEAYTVQVRPDWFRVTE